ncbi:MULTISPECIES: isoaspartyl peptidase/L-asparaginase family protein [Croceibacter]|jgi:N4-(beta-N-acetylglucosaminyl)-L-asparaginase|uniref:isoaspartyl peptidase/L-asparaginase family protein n=1 Tax=Croceibacter TaxID=216431 RepID=UPI000C471CE1|nr:MULTISPECIES: N(4)-(beta-N-acetylglucosaminyl)-L-asparaginase [Croceibacter]MBG24700.1 glycosylasparaginase [Croceibacter sp.]HAT69880.1 glycosylasparaginase [Flavobacteriaceae bacterium]|tara:strand:+ start:2464 stop:3468 length:1005 start_codon:yes stop_codon:yes gene_type:complete
MKRRQFIQQSALGTVGLAVAGAAISCDEQNLNKEMSIPQKETLKKSGPIAICTWGFVDANKTAGQFLDAGKPALDAVIAGVQVEEDDIRNTTVGKGGAPDRSGEVTLDACVMNPDGDCGAVVYVKDYAHVAQLARIVMEETPHVMLAGEGAEELAERYGFKKDTLLTEQSEKAYKEWLKSPKYKPIINIENHDTIGLLAIDKFGDIAGACTTSGLSYKMKGRVGDSAIIGSGLFLDNEIGGAVATGMGEEIMKTVGSFLIVELMRQGKTPQEACDEAVKRVIERNPNYKNFQVAYIALDKQGNTGGACIHKGFTYEKYENEENTRVQPSHILND